MTHSCLSFADHVEQFKQELNREVMNMTEEVGRLYREKQVVENQISELFAFYTKQKPAPPVSSYLVSLGPVSLKVLEMNMQPSEMNYVHGPATSQQALPPPGPPAKRVRANTTPLPRSSYPSHRPLPYPR